MVDQFSSRKQRAFSVHSTAASHATSQIRYKLTFVPTSSLLSDRRTLEKSALVEIVSPPDKPNAATHRLQISKVT